MSDDLVKRLLAEYPATMDMISTNRGDLLEEAANRIAALEAEVARLREAVAQSQYALSWGKAILRDYGTLATPPIDDALALTRAALDAGQ